MFEGVGLGWVGGGGWGLGAGAGGGEGNIYIGSPDTSENIGTDTQPHKEVISPIG